MRREAWSASAAIIAGGAAEITHTGLFFVPALVVLVIATARLWRERSLAPGGGAR